MLLDCGERAIDGFVIGDVTFDAEQPVGGTGPAMGDSNLVAVGGQPLRYRQPDPPVTAGDQDRTGYERGFDPASVGAGGYVSHPDNLSLECCTAESCPGSAERRNATANIPIRLLRGVTLGGVV